MILQVLVKGSGNRVFDRCFHRMSCKTGAYPLAESGWSATPLLRMIRCLSDGSSAHYASHGTLTERGVLPMFDIRMTLAGNGSL